MKNKHNKKRNTAFVYESLVREVTVSIIKGDKERKDAVISILKEYFAPDSILRHHLECYRSLYENQDLSPDIGEKVIREAKMAARLIDPQGLFQAQTKLINDVNKKLSPEVFNNFVPNYKTIATIDQILSTKVSPKQRVMLESWIVSNMSEGSDSEQISENIDNLTLNSFAKKFNIKYETLLMQEQKSLLSLYITSFSDNGVELKTFLNEEVLRLKKAILESKNASFFEEDQEMASKASLVIEKLDNLFETTIDEKVLLTILKTQELVKELNNGSDH